MHKQNVLLRSHAQTQMPDYLYLFYVFLARWFVSIQMSIWLRECVNCLSSTLVCLIPDVYMITWMCLRLTSTVWNIWSIDFVGIQPCPLSCPSTHEWSWCLSQITSRTANWDSAENLNSSAKVSAPITYLCISLYYISWLYVLLWCMKRSSNESHNMMLTKWLRHPCGMIMTSY